MKLSKFFTLGAVAGMATAAVATTTLTSGNTYGIVALADTTCTNLIISIPWVDCTDSSQGTLVSNVVKTTNLTAGDYIIRKSGTTYQSWVLTGEAPNLYWKPQTVADAGVTTTTDGADTARMTRGDALWLHRSNPASSSPIYLFGQYTNTTATSTISAGAATLVGNASGSAIAPGSFTWSSGGPASGDRIMVNTASGYRTYTYDGSAWKPSYQEVREEQFPASCTSTLNHCKYRCDSQTRC